MVLAMWSTEEKIRWGFAAATAALLIVLGAALVLFQDALSVTRESSGGTLNEVARLALLEGELSRTRLLFGVLAAAITALSVLLALLLRRVLGIHALLSPSRPGAA